MGNGHIQRMAAGECSGWRLSMAPPPIFRQTGTAKEDFWLVNDSRDFGFMPPINDIPGLPIRLHVGTPDFGEIHLKKHQNKWPRYMLTWPPAQILYSKLESSGSVFITESRSKFKVALYLKPAALLVVEYRYLYIEGAKEFYWSVISLHPRDLARLDGEVICNYRCVR